MPGVVYVTVTTVNPDGTERRLSMIKNKRPESPFHGELWPYCPFETVPHVKLSDVLAQLSK